MTPTDSRSLRVDGTVQFRPGFRYVGFGRLCRVEVVPALGTGVGDSARAPDWLQYVTYQPGSWFVFFSQFGEHYWHEREVETAEISRFVDLAAFQWRQRRTGNFWVRNPMDVFATFDPGEPYSFDLDHNPQGKLSLNKPGFVYLVEAVGLNRVRIGWTASPDRRPGELVRHSPSQLNMLALLPGSRLDETHLQFMLSGLRLHDDWFQLNDEVRTFLAELKRRWRKPGTYPARALKDLQAPIGEQGVPL